jgi:pimeloyl-ACP methyl ester carboxylesterase
MAPFLPDYLSLLVRPGVPDDLERCAAAFADEAPRITLFSISFGSWPALEVAARRDGTVDGVITFGGYADFERAVRFCLREGSDPLNPPALFLNLLPYLECPDRAAVAAGWREMARRTWGRMELKAPGRLEPYARDIAAGLPAAVRELFWIGCGLADGYHERVETALTRGRAELSFASPAAAIPRVRCPVVICHGRDDDVIPWTEAEELDAALSPHTATRMYLTGLYGHSGAARPTVREAAREGATLLAMAGALAWAGRFRESYSRR